MNKIRFFHILFFFLLGFTVFFISTHQTFTQTPGSVPTTCNGMTVTITGTTGNDAIEGTIGDDVIHGGPGNDIIEGFGGNDVICGGAGEDIISGGDGNDTIFGNEDTDYIYGDGEDDSLFGNEGTDRTIDGGDGTDTVDGGPNPLGRGDTCKGETMVNCEGAVVANRPVADAGPNKIGHKNIKIQIDGSGSFDPDGGELSYFWFLLAKPDNSTNSPVFDPLTATPSIRPDVPGTYVMRLAVFNGIRVSPFDIVIIKAGNLAPVAKIDFRFPLDIGRNFFVGNTVLLKGTGSSDPNGDRITWHWSLISKPPGSNAELTVSPVAFSNFRIDEPGDYVVQLIVNDGETDSEPAIFTVSTSNMEPRANAGLDQTVFVNNRVILDGSLSSDLENAPLTYSWTFLDKPTNSMAELVDADTVSPEFTADSPGTYLIQLIVNDGELDSNPNTVVITTGNTKPVADAGEDQITSLYSTVQLDGSLSFDVDNDPLSYDWDIISKPEDSETFLEGRFTSTPTFEMDAVGMYIIQLIVNDRKLNSEPDTVTITTGNIPPIADAGRDQRVPVGTEIELDGILSFDINDDALTYLWSLVSKPPGSNVQLDSTEQKTRLTLDVAGIYIAQLIVNDGTEDSNPSTTRIIAEQPLTETPSELLTPPVGTTFVGRILDANSAYEGLINPVSGATVSILDTTIVSTSDSDGFFRLENIPSETNVLKIDTSTVTGSIKYASFVEAVPLIENKLSHIERPFYLPRIDTTGAGTVVAGSATTVDNTNLGVSLTIPADAATNLDGTPFTGTISVSEVPRGFPPAVLPEELDPGLLITIQPVGITFRNPVPVTFPNIDNLPAGSEIDIWSLDPDNGVFKIVGTGRVTPDGTKIETISGGISSSTWHMNLPPGPGGGGDDDDDDDCEDDDCCDIPLGSGASPSNGNLTEFHRLVSYRSLNRDRSLSFVYNSNHVNPKPVIQAQSQILRRGAVPNSTSINIEVDGTIQSTELFTSTTGFSENRDEPFIKSVQFDASGLETGIYPYKLKVSSNFSRSTVSRITRKNIKIINNTNSPYGSGWTLEGIQRLYVQNESLVLIEEGNSSGVEFTRFPNIDVENAETIVLPYPSSQDTPIWSYNQQDNSFFQSANSRASAYIFPDQIEEKIITGTLEVQTTADDDWIGLVMGYRNPEDFLFIAWSGADRDSNLEGIHLSKVAGSFRYFNMVPEDNSEILISDTGDGTGWVAITEYQYELKYSPSNITFSIDGREVFNHDSIFPVGRIGFYNSSQMNVRYTIRTSDNNLSKNFISEAGDNSTLLINEDNTFTRTLKDGTKINFNAKGLQTSVVERNGNTTKYHYSRKGRLKRITDPAGLVTTLIYSMRGKLIKITDPVGRITRFRYDADGNLTRIIDPDRSRRIFSYNADGKMISQTSKNGYVTTYEYDSFGKVTKAKRPDGSVRSLSPQKLIGLPNDGTGTEANPMTVLRPEDRKATFTDSNGNITTYELKGGHIVSTTDSLGRTTTSERDQNNNIIRSVDARGNVTTFTYDRNGNLLTSTNQGINATTTFTYTTDGFNNVKTVTDPNGNTITNNYDDKGNLTSTVDALGNTTTYTYDSFGNVLTITDALDNTIVSSYNSHGNLIGTRDQLNNMDSTILDSAGNVISHTDSLDRTTKYEYDIMNRLTKVIDPGLAETVYGYDKAGNLTSVTDANGNKTTFTYDAYNRILSKTDPLGNSETVTYDMQGNLKTTTDRKGQVITYSYDNANRLTSKVLPGGLATTYTYDNSDNIASITDPDSKLTMTYDTSNRLSSVSTANSPAQPSVNITYSYDKSGNLTRMTDPNGNTNYVYDKNNRLTSLTNPSNSTVGFTYDKLNRPILRTYPNGVSTSYSYNARGDLLNLVNAADTTTISSFAYTYDNAGKRTALDQQRSGVTVNSHIDYTYDNLDRLLTATNQISGSPNETFSYDAAGNRLTKTGQMTNSTFNKNNQLLSDADFTYEYDLNGNLIKKTSKGDSPEITTYSYDAENRLIRVEKGTSVSTFKYDGLGRRIEKNLNGTVTRYVYEDASVEANVKLIYDGENMVVNKITNGLTIDNPLISLQDGKNYYYSIDGLNSVSELIDGSIIGSANNIAKTYVYDSFGNIASESGTLSNYSQYTGREFDAETELYYYRARYYDAKTGIFITPDPSHQLSSLGNDSIPFLLPEVLVSPGQLNTYSYVLNSPLNATDPTGLIRCECTVNCLGEPRFIQVYCVQIIKCLVCGKEETIVRDFFIQWQWPRPFYFVGEFDCSEFPGPLPIDPNIS